MLTSYLKECSGNYSKTLWGLWQYYRGKPVLEPNANIIDFSAADNNSVQI